MAERVGLFGWPIEHSVSPAMHNAAFAALGLDWRYERLPVRPGELAGEVARLVDAGYRGFNVTIPHKVEALQISHDASDTAKVVGAANTLVVGDGGSLYAENTDAPGFWDDLVAHGVAHPPGDALILGTGGSARAVTYALVTHDWRVHVLSREDARAEAFASQTGDGTVRAMPRADLAMHSEPVSLIVNCTPAGMWPHTDLSPWPENVALPSSVAVYDLVYTPSRTTFMAQAEGAGARAIGGLGMLVRQGALAFELWTGRQPPLDVMRRAAEEALAEVR